MQKRRFKKKTTRVHNSRLARNRQIRLPVLSRPRKSVVDHGSHSFQKNADNRAHAVTTSNQPAVYLRVLSPRICAPLCRPSRWSDPLFPSVFYSAILDTKRSRNDSPSQSPALTLRTSLSERVRGHVAHTRLLRPPCALCPIYAATRRAIFFFPDPTCRRSVFVIRHSAMPAHVPTPI